MMDNPYREQQGRFNEIALLYAAKALIAGEATHECAVMADSLEDGTFNICLGIEFNSKINSLDKKVTEVDKRLAEL